MASERGSKGRSGAATDTTGCALRLDRHLVELLFKLLVSNLRTADKLAAGAA